MKDEGLTLVASERMKVMETEVYPAEVISPNHTSTAKIKSSDKLMEAAAVHFGEILQLAGSIVEISRIQVQTDSMIALMREEQNRLRAETASYVECKKTDTESAIKCIDAVRMLMQDYYRYNNNYNLDSESFSKIIIATLDKFGEKNE